MLVGKKFLVIMKKIILFFIFMFLFFQIVFAENDNRIIYPIWNFPAIVRTGDELNILTEKEILNVDEVSICEQECIKIKGLNNKKGVKINIPEGFKEGFYDLKLKVKDKEYESRRSIKIIKEYKEEFLFVHLTDIHIGGETSEKTFEEVIKIINLINPEFVVITGDSVTTAEDFARTIIRSDNLNHYLMDISKKKIIENLIKAEFNEFISLCQRIKVPLFIIPGNHDLVGVGNNLLLDIWKEYFYWRYYSFNYNNWHFVGLDNSNMMEVCQMIGYEDKDCVDLDDEQKEWLIESMQKSNLKNHIFLLHINPLNDRGKFIVEIANKYSVKMGLFGHDHKDMLFIEGKTIWAETASVFERGAFRVIKIKNEDIEYYGEDNPVCKIEGSKIADILLIQKNTKGVYSFCSKNVRDNCDFNLNLFDCLKGK